MDMEAMLEMMGGSGEPDPLPPVLPLAEAQEQFLTALKASRDFFEANSDRVNELQDELRDLLKQSEDLKDVEVMAHRAWTDALFRDNGLPVTSDIERAEREAEESADAPGLYA